MVRPVKKPVVSKDEIKYRNEVYPNVAAVKNKNVLCTSCNASLKEPILKKKPKTHPFLETLLCEKCSTFFGDGEFSVDEDGSDKYCRWCGQGGTLYLCSSCTAGFCKKCIKRNLPRAVLTEVEEDEWECFCCNVKPLYELRAHCWAANKFASIEDKKKKKGRAEENEGSHKENKKKSAYCEPVVSKLAATIKDALSMTSLFQNKATECLNKKINENYIKDVKNAEIVCGKICKLLLAVEELSHELRSSVTEFLDDWKKGTGESTDNVNKVEDRKESSIVHDKEEENEEEGEEKEGTVNGIENDDKSSKDRLGVTSEEEKVASRNEDSEQSKINENQDESSPKVENENDDVSDSNITDYCLDGTVKLDDTLPPTKNDDNEVVEEITKLEDETPSKRKRIDENSDDKDGLTIEKEENCKKLKPDASGDNLKVEESC